MKSSNASPSVFGTDFQANAAIFLALENIKELAKLRMEGEKQDIELTLKNGKKLYAQAKSVVNAKTDYNNVRRNLKDALVSLSNADSNNIIKLIFITNSNNPFNDKESMAKFYGPPTEIEYKDLPDSAKKVIDDILKREKIYFDLNKLLVKYFMFETDNEREKYKVIRQEISEFINRLDLNISYEELMDIWQHEVFKNGTKIDTEITINKKDMIWPVVVLAFRKNDCHKLLDEYDDGLIEEINKRYNATINNRIERYDVVTKVIYNFESCRIKGTSAKQSIINFIEDRWWEYIDLFSLESIQDVEIKEGVCKLILSKILDQRFTIDKIKKGVVL